MKNIIIAVIATFVLTYFGGVFISWQPNPGLWTDSGRFCYVFMSALISFFAGFVVYVKSQD